MSIQERTPVQISQFGDEFDRLLKIYRQRKPRRVLEIGSWQGGTLFHWLKNVRSPATVVSVDLYKDPLNDRRELYSDWAPAGVSLEVIVGDSTKPYTKRKIRKFAPYQWAFIDGDHTYDTVRSDFKLCLKVVEPGGVIALHDIVASSEEWLQVDQLWEEIEQEHKTDKYIVGRYGGIGVVYV